MHTALLAVVPSVSEQSGPVAQRQVRVEEHLVLVEPVFGLNLRLSLPYSQHPGGCWEYASALALVSL